MQPPVRQRSRTILRSCGAPCLKAVAPGVILQSGGDDEGGANRRLPPHGWNADYVRGHQDGHASASGRITTRVPPMAMNTRPMAQPTIVLIIRERKVSMACFISGSLVATMELMAQSDWLRRAGERKPRVSRWRCRCSTSSGYRACRLDETVENFHARAPPPSLPIFDTDIGMSIAMEDSSRIAKNCNPPKNLADHLQRF